MDRDIEIKTEYKDIPNLGFANSRRSPQPINNWPAASPSPDHYAGVFECIYGLLYSYVCCKFGRTRSSSFLPRDANRQPHI